LADAARGARRRGLLVYNPKAGGATRRVDISGVVARAASRGLDLDAVPTERPRHATELVAARLGSALDVVAVAGGDGTLGEAAEAVLGRRVPLAILPAGTANVVAREYGVAEADAAEAALFSGKTRPLTVFRAAGRACVIGAGIGFDARVMAHTVPVLKRLFGRAGIGWTATLEWLKYEFPAIEVEGVDAEGRAFRREATFVLSANTSRYGGDPILSPHADPADDLLDLVLFASRSTKTLMLFYHHLSGGKAAHLGDEGVSRMAVRSFTARSLAGYELEVQVDGDGTGTTPVTVGPAAGQVGILVPE
jgi:diacylglycerol kinase family enzyme